MNVFEIAEEEGVQVLDVFAFAFAHFAIPNDCGSAQDYEDFSKGGKVPVYVDRMLHYRQKDRLV